MIAGLHDQQDIQSVPARVRAPRTLSLFGLGFAAISVAGCVTPPEEPPSLVELGEQIFFNETFDGNGRTCGSCHRAEDNFALSPAFIATLPDDDPLFVAEQNADLAENFENPRLMRELALIFENQDGFDDLENDFNMRGVPHTLALSTSIESRLGPQTGWSGDGAPGDGSLRAFSTGAVIQHFTKTTNRIAGVDFRLPTDEELDALEAFQLSLGRQVDLDLPLPLRNVVVARGQEILSRQYAREVQCLSRERGRKRRSKHFRARSRQPELRHRRRGPARSARRPNR